MAAAGVQYPPSRGGAGYDQQQAESGRRSIRSMNRTTSATAASAAQDQPHGRSSRGFLRSFGRPTTPAVDGNGSYNNNMRSSGPNGDIVQQRPTTAATDGRQSIVRTSSLTNMAQQEPSTPQDPTATPVPARRSRRIPPTSAEAAASAAASGAASAQHGGAPHQPGPDHQQMSKSVSGNGPNPGVRRHPPSSRMPPDAPAGAIGPEMGITMSAGPEDPTARQPYSRKPQGTPPMVTSMQHGDVSPMPSPMSYRQISVQQMQTTRLPRQQGPSQQPSSRRPARAEGQPSVIPVVATSTESPPAGSPARDVPPAYHEPTQDLQRAPAAPSPQQMQQQLPYALQLQQQQQQLPYALQLQQQQQQQQQQLPQQAAGESASIESEPQQGMAALQQMQLHPMATQPWQVVAASQQLEGGGDPSSVATAEGGSMVLYHTISAEQAKAVQSTGATILTDEHGQPLMTPDGALLTQEGALLAQDGTALVGADSSALVLYQPPGADQAVHGQADPGAIVLYQPPIEQAQTISQMLQIIQHLQGEVQSLRWMVQQLREDAEVAAQKAATQSAEDLKTGLLDGIGEMREIINNRDLQQRARLFNSTSARERDALERLPNDKGELPKKFPHCRRDVVGMPPEIVTYLIEFYDLPKEPWDSRLDRVARFIGIRLG